MTDGIHIPQEIADAEGVPEDLDASVVGPYRFPDPHRRRIAGWIYLAAGIVAALVAIRESGAWVVVGLCAALAVWHFRAAWPLGIDQSEALALAAAQMPFPVGHASAAVAFSGLRARPRWQVIGYSADEPPSQRALAEFDAVDGSAIGDVYVEDIPQA